MGAVDQDVSGHAARGPALSCLSSCFPITGDAFCTRARGCGEVGRATTGDWIMKFSAAAGVLAASSMLWLALPAWAASCKTQAAMTDAERMPVVEAARQIGQDVESGRTAELQAATVPEVAAHFDAIANAA